MRLNCLLLFFLLLLFSSKPVLAQEIRHSFEPDEQAYHTPPPEKYSIVGSGGYCGVVEKDLTGVKSPIEILPAVYIRISIIHDSYVILEDKAGQTGLYNLHSRKLIVPMTKQRITEDHNFLLVTDQQGKIALYGFSKGELMKLSEDTFDRLRFTDEGILVQKDGHYGIFDSENKAYLIQPVYDSIIRTLIHETYDRSNNWQVRQNGRYGLVGADGKELIAPVYDSLAEGKAHIAGWSGGRLTIYTQDGSKKLTKKAKAIKFYDKVLAYQDAKKSKWGLLTPDLGDLLLPEYDSIGFGGFSDPYDEGATSGLLFFAQNSRQLEMIKYRDSTTKSVVVQGGVILRSYQDAFIVRKQGKQGAFDRKLRQICFFEYDVLYPWMWFEKGKTKEGLAGRKGEITYILSKGISVDSIIADSLALLDVNGFRAIRDGKYALVRRLDAYHSGFVYDYIAYSWAKSSARQYLYRRGNYYGYLTSEGKCVDSVVIPPKGVATLDELPEAFVAALKADNDSILRRFAWQMTPDYGTYEFLEKHSIDFRGFKNNFAFYAVSSSADEYFNVLRSFQESLKNHNLLQQLTTTGFKKAYGTTTLKGIRVQATESPVVLIAGDTRLEFKLGELVLIGGQVKSFTKPRQLH